MRRIEPNDVVNDGKVISGIGWREWPGVKRHYHTGLDIVSDSNDDRVRSARPGVVVSTKTENDGWGGKVITLEREEDGIDRLTLYAHLRQVDVKEGQSIAVGAIIGRYGNTGVSRGAHLHFETRRLRQRSDANINSANVASFFYSALVENPLGDGSAMAVRGDRLERDVFLDKNKWFIAIAILLLSAVISYMACSAFSATKDERRLTVG